MFKVFCIVVFDMCVEIEDMVVVGDCVLVYLCFCGYFIGEFGCMYG